MTSELVRAKTTRRLRATRAVAPAGDEIDDLAGLDIGVHLRSANSEEASDLGGDWCDVFSVGEKVFVALGDVSGHGGAARDDMLQLRDVMRDWAFRLRAFCQSATVFYVSSPLAWSRQRFAVT